MSKQTLLKFGYMEMPEASARVIDTNEKMEERLRQLRRKSYEDPSQFEEAQFPNQLEASDVARLLADDDGEAGGESFSEGSAAQAIEEAGLKARQIVEDAHGEAERILEDARAEAERVKQGAHQAGLVEGKREGLEAGRVEAMAEMERAKAELAEQERRLEDDYQARLAELEPMLVDAISDIYGYVFHSSIREKKEIVQKLLSDTIRKVEGCKEFIVHVSKSEYERVKQHKEELLEAAASASASLEVIEDYSLAGGECMVETENGIYDCSLDVQLESLREQLMLLSYQKD